jgi:hypothetical protein
MCSKRSACEAQADRAGVPKQIYFTTGIHSFTLNTNSCKIHVDASDTCSADRACGKAGIRVCEVQTYQIHRILSKLLELLQPSYKAPFIFWLKEWVILGLLQNNAIVFVSFRLPIYVMSLLSMNKTELKHGSQILATTHL